jgi:NAD(P)-dependent dehydrogenase (short-subunit alcohol dehydrogenase family)
VLVLADLNAERGEALAGELRRQHGSDNQERAAFVRGDVAEPAEVRRLIEGTVERHGRIDVLINNAGYAVYKGIEETTEEEWRRVLDVNLSAHFYAIKYAAPHLRGSKGAVVNIASGRALRTTPEVFAYTTAKTGVVGLTRAAALDLAPDVRVNAVLPGAIDTPMHRENVAATTDLEAGMRRIRERIPLKRHGQPSDVAQLVLFLASDESAWITGAAYVVDGGGSAVLP